MCPACMTTAAVLAGGTTLGAGAIAFVVSRWRKLLRRFAPTLQQRS